MPARKKSTADAHAQRRIFFLMRLTVKAISFKKVFMQLRVFYRRTAFLVAIALFAQIG